MVVQESVAFLHKHKEMFRSERIKYYLMDSSMRNEYNENLRNQYFEILTRKNDKVSVPEQMMILRTLVLTKGLPEELDEIDSNSQNPLKRTSLRGLVWKLLLGTLYIDAVHYILLVKAGPCVADKKIRDDTFRTFKGDAEFWSKVSECKMKRVLSAFVRYYFQSFPLDDDLDQSADGNTKSSEKVPPSSTNAANSHKPGGCSNTASHKATNSISEKTLSSSSTAKPNPPTTSRSGSCTPNSTVPAIVSQATIDEAAALAHDGYVQGMNILVAPFLYVMPELDAFSAFSNLLMKHCPRYIMKNLDGVHHGCSLVERCLEILDAVLYRHLISRIFTEIFAFRTIMTLLASLKPLQEALRVWDGIFAFGVHFNVILYTAHIMIMRDDLLKESNASKLQKILLEAPLTDGRLLVSCAMRLVRFLPDTFFEELVTHPVQKTGNVENILSKNFQSESTEIGTGADRRPLSASHYKKKTPPNNSDVAVVAPCTKDNSSSSTHHGVSNSSPEPTPTISVSLTSRKENETDRNTNKVQSRSKRSLSCSSTCSRSSEAPGSHLLLLAQNNPPSSKSSTITTTGTAGMSAKPSQTTQKPRHTRPSSFELKKSIVQHGSSKQNNPIKSSDRDRESKGSDPPEEGSVPVAEGEGGARPPATATRPSSSSMSISKKESSPMTSSGKHEATNPFKSSYKYADKSSHSVYSASSRASSVASSTNSTASASMNTNHQWKKQPQWNKYDTSRSSQKTSAANESSYASRVAPSAPSASAAVASSATATRRVTSKSISSSDSTQVTGDNLGKQTDGIEGNNSTAAGDPVITVADSGSSHSQGQGQGQAVDPLRHDTDNMGSEPLELVSVSTTQSSGSTTTATKNDTIGTVHRRHGHGEGEALTQQHRRSVSSSAMPAPSSDPVPDPDHRSQDHSTSNSSTPPTSSTTGTSNNNTKTSRLSSWGNALSSLSNPTTTTTTTARHSRHSTWSSSLSHSFGKSSSNPATTNPTRPTSHKSTTKSSSSHVGITASLGPIAPVEDVKNIRLRDRIKMIESSIFNKDRDSGLSGGRASPLPLPQQKQTAAGEIPVLVDGARATGGKSRDSSPVRRTSAGSSSSSSRVECSASPISSNTTNISTSTNITTMSASTSAMLLHSFKYTHFEVSPVTGKIASRPKSAKSCKSATL